MATSADEYWNHNVHYQRVILNAVPDGCGAAVDVGCGDGLLVRKLAGRCASVTGVDRDAPILARALERSASLVSVTYVEGDFLTCPFADDSFDFACANTSLHHMDFAAALAKMAGLLRPDGRLAVVGLGSNGSLADRIIGAAGIPANLYYKRTRGEHNPGAPITGPDMTWSQIRKTATRLLPGVRYRRHLLWRYSLIWTKP
jgi:ubiquinone/menaquinone biosynthesis C-methylase UbiE